MAAAAFLYSGDAGDKIYTYVRGTTTNQATQTSSSLATNATNPVIVPAGGDVVLYFDDTLSFTFLFKDSSDVQKIDMDYVAGAENPYQVQSFSEDGLNALLASYNAALAQLSPDAVEQVADIDAEVVTTASISSDISTVAAAIADGTLGDLISDNGYFFTIALAQASTILYGLTGSVIFVERFSTVDGRGGGFFRVEPTGTYTVDNVIVFENSAGASTVHLVRAVSDVNGWVPVSWAGAIGDGVTDDTTAIQRVIDTGYNVLFEEGTYETSSPLFIQTDGQKLAGVRGQGFSGGGVEIQPEHTTGPGLQILASDVEISDIRIYGRGNRGIPFPAGSYDEEGDGIVIGGKKWGTTATFSDTTNQCLIRNVLIRNHPGDGIRFVGPGACSKVEQCQIEEIGRHGMFFDDGTYAGIHGDDNAGTNTNTCGLPTAEQVRVGAITVSECIVKNMAGCGAVISPTGSRCFRMTFINNDMSNNNAQGIAHNASTIGAPNAIYWIRAEDSTFINEAPGSDNGSGGSEIDSTGAWLETPCESIRFVNFRNAGTARIAYIEQQCEDIVFDGVTISQAIAKGFDIQANCDGVKIRVVNEDNITTLVHAADPCGDIEVGNQKGLIVGGNVSNWWIQGQGTATIASGVLNTRYQTTILDGEGDAADTLTAIYHATSSAPIDDRAGLVTLVNINSYDITINTTGNLELGSGVSTLTLAQDEAVSFMPYNGKLYKV